MVVAKRVDRNERGRPVGLFGVVQGDDSDLLGMGVNGGGHTLQGQDSGVDIGLRGGLVIAEIGLAGGEEADMAGLEITFLGAGGGDDNPLIPRLVPVPDGHVAAVAVLDVVEKRSPADGLKKAEDFLAW